MADFQLRGVDTMLARFKSIDRNARAGLSEGAEDEANDIVARAKELVPFDTGALSDSIHVVSGELEQGRSSLGQFTSGADVVVAVTAGDDTIPYTLAIHEHPSAYDPPSWAGIEVQFHKPGTGPKFLERPFLESLPGMAERVGSRVSSKIG